MRKVEEVEVDKTIHSSDLYYRMFIIIINFFYNVYY